jgi:hypothetical protein
MELTAWERMGCCASSVITEVTGVGDWLINIKNLVEVQAGPRLDSLSALGAWGRSRPSEFVISLTSFITQEITGLFTTTPAFDAALHPEGHISTLTDSIIRPLRRDVRGDEAQPHGAEDAGSVDKKIREFTITEECIGPHSGTSRNLMEPRAPRPGTSSAWTASRRRRATPDARDPDITEAG